MKNLTQKEFEKKLSEVNKYFNSFFKIIGEFVNCRTKIKILTPYGLCLANTYNLLDGNKPTIQTAIDKNDYFINMSKEIHGEIYDYSKVNYVNFSTKVQIICPEHGVFEQKPNGHLNGNGCPKCNTGGWEFKLSDWLNTKGDNATFYILRCYSNGEEFIKIGITTTTIKERYRKKDSIPYQFDVMHETTSTNKKLIWDMERNFMRNLKEYSYLPKMDFKGKTECFNIKSLNY